MNTAKPYKISKHVVLEAYNRVKANKGAAGVDDESISDFEENLKDNLYKIWNRMSSGSYIPLAVRLVEIPKSDGGKRKLGIPTVTDRVAQMVAKIYLEPGLEKHFHEDSYGYRPGKSALDAVGLARKRCWQYHWVIDLDIKGFFDNLDHELLMRAIRKHTNCKWLLLYIERWLTAPVQLADGRIQERTMGTPQGGVISPLLANLFLHYTFDEWMKRNYPNNPFERYADDVIVHCKTSTEATSLKSAIEERLKDCKLELHPLKTKIVYCKDDNRKEIFPEKQFDFLGYTFRPRHAKSKEGKYFVSFSPAISTKAAKSIKQTMREWKLQVKCNRTIEEIAEWINPVLRGWINYYGKFRKTALNRIFSLLNIRLTKWAKWKYKKLKGQSRKAMHWLGDIAKQKPTLFAHWELGIHPGNGQ
ncbi:group II intron reverse transcriptase/maturase [soil metagenome]